MFYGASEKEAKDIFYQGEDHRCNSTGRCSFDHYYDPVVVYDFQQNHFDKRSKPVRIIDQLSVREYRRVVK